MSITPSHIKVSTIKDRDCTADFPTRKKANISWVFAVKAAIVTLIVTTASACTSIRLLNAPTNITRDCTPLWVRISGGEARIFGRWKSVQQSSIIVDCGIDSEIPITPAKNKTFGLSGGVFLHYDGATLDIYSMGFAYKVFPTPRSGDTYFLNNEFMRSVRIDVAPALR
jgi:hypothetical protein